MKLTLTRCRVILSEEEVELIEELINAYNPPPLGKGIAMKQRIKKALSSASFVEVEVK